MDKVKRVKYLGELQNHYEKVRSHMITVDNKLWKLFVKYNLSEEDIQDFIKYFSEGLKIGNIETLKEILKTCDRELEQDKETV